MKRHLLALVVGAACCTTAMAQDAFEKKTFVSAGDTLRYQELTPLATASGEKQPLVIFLHGSGERGKDNQLQMTHGSQMWLNPANREQFPCYVIFPQCPEGATWIAGDFGNKNRETTPNDPSAGERLICELIEKYIEAGKVDPSRVYIMGLSMGGYGVFDIVSRFPDHFAAAVAICGSIQPEKLSRQSAEKMQKVKFFIYHGDADPVVSVEGSRNAYRQLRKMGVTVDYTEFVACTHNSWTPAFNHPNFLKNIFNCHR